jgi:leucyl-tRNA synthetase
MPNGKNMARKKTKRSKPKTTLIKPKYYVLDMFPYPSGAGYT